MFLTLLHERLQCVQIEEHLRHFLIFSVPYNFFLMVNMSFHSQMMFVRNYFCQFLVEDL